MPMLVAAHKPAEMPAASFYMPIHVGHALSSVDLGYQADDEGENISELNASYCELTAVFWAWKNLCADVVGICHYRRFFKGTAPGPRGTRVMSETEAKELLSRHDIVVGRRRHYLVETIESHYRNAHHSEDIEVLRQVVADVSPTFLDGYDQIFGGRRLSLYNMMLARHDLFDEYAAWLFPILAETSRRLGVPTDRTAYQQRTMGYLGERLLNVWVAGRPELKVARVAVVNVDGEPKIRKGVRMLARKARLTDATRRMS